LKNISRLVKLAGDSNQPQSVYRQPINKAPMSYRSPRRERKNKIMTAKKIFKIFAYAATILLVCGVLAAVMMPSFYKSFYEVRAQSQLAARLDQERQYNLQKSSESQRRTLVIVKGEQKGTESPVAAPSPLEYTRGGNKPLVASDMKAARELDKAERLAAGQPGDRACFSRRSIETKTTLLWSIARSSPLDALSASVLEPPPPCWPRPMPPCSRDGQWRVGAAEW
jgi:hypothetical protein